MDDDLGERRELSAALSRSQELLRQATALLAEVDRGRAASAQMLADIRRKVLESQQFRDEHRHLLDHSLAGDEASLDDLD